MMKSVTILALVAYNILSPSRIRVSEKDLAADHKVFPREGYVQFQQDAIPITPNQFRNEVLPNEENVQFQQEANPNTPNQVGEDILPSVGDIQFRQNANSVTPKQVSDQFLPSNLQNLRPSTWKLSYRSPVSTHRQKNKHEDIIPSEGDVQFQQEINLTTPNQVSEEIIPSERGIQFKQEANPTTPNKVSEEILPIEGDVQFQQEANPTTPKQVNEGIIPSKGDVLFQKEANPTTPNQVSEVILTNEGDVQLQQKNNPNTPNQVSDSLILCVISNLEKRGWCTSKSVQKIGSEIQYNVKNHGNSIETFSIANSKVTGLCNIKRSNIASFKNNKSVLAATFVVNDLHLEADYTVVFPGTGKASSKTRSGIVTEKVSKMFADMEVKVKDLKPQKIQSYSVRAGHDELVVRNDGCEKGTNIGGKIVPILLAGFKNSSRQILKDTMVKSMKIVINQSIHNCNS